MPFVASDYKAKIPFQENPLLFLRFAIIDLLQYRFTRWIVVFSLCVSSVVRVIEFYFFWENVSFLKFVQFGPAYIVYIYGMTSAFLMLLYRKDVEKYMSKEVDDNKWSVHSAGPAICSEIYKRARKIYVYVAVCSTSLVLTATCMLLQKQSAVEFHYVLNLLYKRWQVTGPAFLVFRFCYNIVTGPIACSMVYHPFLIVYSCQQIMFQAMMLIDHIKKVTWDFEHEANESVLFADEEYQRVVHERLVFCVKWHIELMGVLTSINRNIVQPMFPILTVSSFVLGLGVLMIGYGLYIDVYHASMIDNWQILFELTDFALFFVGVFWNGQGIEDLADNIAEELLNIKYYTFNNSNKIKMLIMIQNSMNPIRFYLSDNLALNYELGIRITRGIYSSLIAAMQLVHL